MKVTWLGHAAFYVSADRQRLRIITDPYTPTEGRVMYKPIDAEADIVTVSHEHGDHNNVAAVRGSPQVFRGLEVLSGVKLASRVINGIEFRAIASYHDDEKGARRGANAIVCFTMDRVRLCHLGDLGHLLDEEAIAAIGHVDVLMCPIGGTYTITPDMAQEVVAKIAPRVVIPMHYRNERCAMPLEEVSAFLAGRGEVHWVEGDAAFRPEVLPLPEPTAIFVLRPAE